MSMSMLGLYGLSYAGQFGSYVGPMLGQWNIGKRTLETKFGWAAFFEKNGKIQRGLNWTTSNMKWRRTAWVSSGSPDSHMEIKLCKRCGPAATLGQLILVAGRCGCTWGTAPRFQSRMTSSSAMPLCTVAWSTKMWTPNQSMLMKVFVELTFVYSIVYAVYAYTSRVWLWLCNDPVVITG